jgi:hypothetical protein
MLIDMLSNLCIYYGNIYTAIFDLRDRTDSYGNFGQRHERTGHLLDATLVRLGVLVEPAEFLKLFVQSNSYAKYALTKYSIFCRQMKQLV